MIQPTATWFDLFRSVPFGIFTGYASNNHVDSGYLRVLNAAKDFNYPIGPAIYIENHDHGSVTCRVGSRDRWYKTQPYFIALMTCPGAIMIHNGQEWGQFEDIWEDDSGAPPQFRRVQSRPLRWDEAMDTIGSTMQDRYRFLFQMRQAHPGLRTPNFYPDYYDLNWRSFSPEGYGIDESKQVIIYHRWGPGLSGAVERFMIVLNFSDFMQLVEIPFPMNGTWMDMINNNHMVTISDYRLRGYGIPSNWGCVFFQHI